ncbi:MAG: 6,7-dimethyl-8-ribityllumazine synthase [Hyphomicrobiaceae bacterium]|nr:6,7-dimethyl-8-ribityllumazine synthase [Hyphomicrobiaceae bacterium]
MSRSSLKAVVGDFPELFQKQHILIIEGHYYEEIGAALLHGAINELESIGASYTHVVVPGALEIPQVLVQALERDLIGIDADEPKFTGVIVLGCVIRGETYHFEIVCTEANRAIMDLTIAHVIPLGNGILTVDTYEQAFERASDNCKGKGREAARACLKLIEVAARFDGEID